jgi:ADP-ribose pyrophosphatase
MLSMEKSDNNKGWTLFTEAPTKLDKEWLQGDLEVHIDPYRARYEWPEGYPRRVVVSDDLVPWSVPYPEYDPPYYVAQTVLDNDATRKPGGWADPEDVSKVESFPAESFEGSLQFDEQGRPLNPRGRTGMAGRGLLGKWGPNFAADPIITRLHPKFGDLEMLAVQRRDNGQWAIPGGMVDKGEEVSRTLARELAEETGVSLDLSEAHLVYQGFVDDPRTTDHAWIETTVKHLHLEKETADKLELEAGSDALSVHWLPITERSLHKLYASHGYFMVGALTQLNRRQPGLLPESALKALVGFFK